MQYYSALKRNELKKKRNELSSHEKTRRKPKCILPSEKNHSEKVTCYMILLYGILRKAKLWG